MAEVKRKPPLALAQSFLACIDVFRDQRTDVPILIGPTSHVPIPEFPAHVRFSFFAELTGLRGHYTPRLVLLDDSDDEAWACHAPPFEHDNPLLPHRIIFYDVTVDVPRLGRYLMVLQLNGDHVAQRPMWFGPAQAFGQ